MPVSVVDASAVGALLFGEPNAEASICLKKIAARTHEKQLILDALALFPALDVILLAVPATSAVTTTFPPSRRSALRWSA